jgi:hypothetical protein
MGLMKMYIDVNKKFENVAAIPHAQGAGCSNEKLD